VQEEKKEMKCPNCGDETYKHTDHACRVCLVELACLIKLTGERK